jgi:magnesium-transporting ATPase (P-type)
VIPPIGETSTDSVVVEPEDPTQVLDLVFPNLRSSASGLNGREAARRLIVDGPNQLTRRGKPQWPRQLLAQFTQPLALLLVAAAVLAAVSGSPPLAIAIVAVIVLNAVFAFSRNNTPNTPSKLSLPTCPPKLACCATARRRT